MNALHYSRLRGLNHSSQRLPLQNLSRVYKDATVTLHELECHTGGMSLECQIGCQRIAEKIMFTIDKERGTDDTGVITVQPCLWDRHIGGP